MLVPARAVGVKRFRSSCGREPDVANKTKEKLTLKAFGPEVDEGGEAYCNTKCLILYFQGEERERAILAAVGSVRPALLTRVLDDNPGPRCQP